MAKINSYYKNDTARLIKFIVPKDTKSTFTVKAAHTKVIRKHDYIVLENIIGD